MCWQGRVLTSDSNTFCDVKVALFDPETQKIGIEDPSDPESRIQKQHWKSYDTQVLDRLSEVFLFWFSFYFPIRWLVLSKDFLDVRNMLLHLKQR